ncbi:uncharacterized protein PV06_01504 [Exophiala oligosperma]|uniref:Acyltransferase 3 domain-containing protein n=1 Tax=Exophiala oligosperma TaxID=215243 RepID=A0A0D2E0L4_9EURO|nr:uncharacterized protein PV06_01504 [Exophiala oligosperma]KIW48948.1 hypothetical protein PV06_01504 [Exophiala oligosperma]
MFSEKTPHESNGMLPSWKRYILQTTQSWRWPNYFPTSRQVNGPDYVALLPESSRTSSDVELGYLKPTSRRIRNPTLDKIHTALLTIFGLLWAAIRPNILTKKEKRELHQSAWLDGIRGVAAFFVFFSHAAEIRWNDLRHGWKHGGYFLQWPIIRVFYEGSSMVSVFFVVSGFAISYKALKLAKAQEHGKIFDTLVSSTFRRGIRLYLPCAAITLLRAITNYIRGTKGAAPTFWIMLWRWVKVVVSGVNPLRLDKWYFNGSFRQLERVMWTIPVEFRGSMVVFLCILVVAKARHAQRMAAIAALIAWSCCVGEWDIVLFVSGTFLCELHHRTSSNSGSNGGDTSFLWRFLSASASILLLLPLLYVLSQPESYWGNGDTPISGWLDAHTPAAWVENKMEAGNFWHCIAAVILIFLVDHSPVLQRFFMSPIPQYLGEISFSLYLLHPWLIDLVGRKIVFFMFRRMKELGPGIGPEYLGAILCLILFLPLLFWVSDISTRWFDRGGVRLARWAEDRFYSVNARS